MCWKIWGFWYFTYKYSKESFGDDRLRAKLHLLKESRRDNTDRERAREGASTSTSTSTKRDADLGVEVTLTDRELHEREL